MDLVVNLDRISLSTRICTSPRGHRGLSTKVQQGYRNVVTNRYLTVTSQCEDITQTKRAQKAKSQLKITMGFVVDCCKSFILCGLLLNQGFLDICVCPTMLYSLHIIVGSLTQM